MKQHVHPEPLRPLARLIFCTRWLQLPLYLGLIVAQCAYVVQFVYELIELVGSFQPHKGGFSGKGSREIMLVVLGLIDVVMISNLLVMVIIGGYETFVSRLRLGGHPDQPEWLSHVNAGVLKVKLAMAIVGISSIHLLKSFIGARTFGLEHAVLLDQEGAADQITAEGIKWQAIIHCIFVLSAIGIVFVDRLSSNAPAHAGESEGDDPSTH